MEITELRTPCLILDEKKFRDHCNWMKDKCKRLGVNLRPHLKTGKSREVALCQMISQEGPATVSTLLEAENFFSWGVRDLIYAVGISPSKFSRAAELIKKGCRLKVILDNVETAKALSNFCEKSHIEIPVLIEIDCDGHRSGVKPVSPDLIGIASALTDGAKLVGVLTHAGDSYGCVGSKACRKAAENERDSIVLAANRLKEAGFNIEIISVGSTPTATFAENWAGCTEVRCGVYCIGDLVMAGVGVYKLEDLALSLLVEVIGHQKEKGWVITDGGWMALSRDRGTASQAVDYGYGAVCDVNGKILDNLYVKLANQEHGVIVNRTGETISPEDFPVGTKLRILPNHACAMAAQHHSYHVVNDGKVIAEWPRFCGW
ncbi:alanine racemase [uncultured Turicimonas sp.]|uniref:alanine racemase n=1 Tax=uncultured Turicimonas sp. TaxID=1918607 RepID=UPI003211C199